MISGILERLVGQRRKLNRELLDAARHGDTARAAALLDQGADVDANDGHYGALAIAGREPDSNAATVRLLPERGADLRGAPRGRGVNPLLRTAHCSDADRIRLLVEAGAPLDLDDRELARGTGIPILQQLVRYADLPTIALVLDRGADLEARSLGYRATALHVAAFYGRADVVRFLLDRGARTDVREAGGRTPLELARDRVSDPRYNLQPGEPETRNVLAAIEVLVDAATARTRRGDECRHAPGRRPQP